MCWNRLSTASLEGERSDEGWSNESQTKKICTRLSILINSTGSCNINYAHVMPLAHGGCAEIGRQLHPLKAKNMRKNGWIKIKQKNILRGNTHQLKGLELVKLTIPLFCLSVHRGCAGNGCQLHPMKEKIRIGLRRIVPMRHPIRRVHLPVLICSYARVYPSVRFSICPSNYLADRPSDRPSVDRLTDRPSVSQSVTERDMVSRRSDITFTAVPYFSFKINIFLWHPL